MQYKPTSDRIIYTGRWYVSEKSVTTSPGAFFECEFLGRSAAVLFDTEGIPRKPHVRIKIDGTECYVGEITEKIELPAKEGTPHRLTVIFKSAFEREGRWTESLTARLGVCGFEAERLLPFSDDRDIAEIIGDSITEGCGIFADRYGSVSELANDSCAAWGFLTAEKLGMRPYIIGYGAQGVTKGGLGGVPKAAEGYPYAFENAPLAPSCAKIVIINHGANDCDASDEEYIAEYVGLLHLVRSRNPEAVVIAVTPFCGIKKDAMLLAVRQYNEESGDCVYCIDATEIVPEKPIHPDSMGQRKLSEYISGQITGILRQ